MPSVFISHRMSDSALAEKLAGEIEAAGHDVSFDVWEVGVGDSIPGWMNSALAKANYVILCYSADGVESPYILQEWLTTLSRQLDGHKVKLLPAVLSGKNVPALMYGVKYADLMADWSQGVKDLLAAIR